MNNLWVEEGEDWIKLMSKTSDGRVFEWIAAEKKAIPFDRSYTGIEIVSPDLDQPETYVRNNQ